MKLGHFDKHSQKFKNKNSPAGENFQVFSPRYSLNYILNGKFNLRMDTIRAFFPKIRTTFLIFKKGQGRPPPPSLPCCALADR